MLSAKCFFRGNYMTGPAAEGLLRNLCSVAELAPEFWNIYEPINNPFRQENMNEVIYGSMVPAEKAKKDFIRTLAFFVRRTKPRYLVSIDLRLAPVQWGTAHNRILIHVEEAWPGGEQKLAQYLLSSVLPNFPDYAKVVDSSQEDSERLNEFRRPLTPQELVESFAKRAVTAPFGPYGCLEDIYWFNYFGPVYVDFIGRARLLAAGWPHVEEIGGGLACYASEAIDAPNARKQRLRIASALEEFVWTPGCKAEDKKVPVFDFTEQFAALPAEALAKLEGCPLVS